MANLLYPKGKENFLSGAIDLTSGVIRAVLVDTGVYSYNAAHDAYDDLSGVVGTESGAFTTKDVTDGVFDAANITFSSVAGGSTAEAVVIFLDTGTPANDLLIAYIDTATGLPVTTNGGDVNVTWDSGANKIFAL